jgi:hypothetical protein
MSATLMRQASEAIAAVRAEREALRELLLEVTDALAEMIGEQSHDPEIDPLVIKCRAALKEGT